MVMKGMLLGVISFMFLSMGIPHHVFDKTWHASGDGEGHQFVIYKDDLGELKAIWQHQGSFVFVEQSIIYEVSISDNTLHFINGVVVLGDDSKPIKDFALIYSEKENAFISPMNAKSFRVIAERPIIYSKFGWLLDIEDLKANSLRESDFK